jgi:hypothetical protein
MAWFYLGYTLARLRGFAPENANFGIFGTAKYLICRG